MRFVFRLKSIASRKANIAWLDQWRLCVSRKEFKKEKDCLDIWRQIVVPNISDNDKIDNELLRFCYQMFSRKSDYYNFDISYASIHLT